MKKRAWVLSLCFIGALIIGIIGGATYSNYWSHQKSIKRLNNDLSAFASILAKAQMDMRESTSNPSTPLQKAYEVNVKVDVGQLSALWTNMSPELIAKGLSVQDVQQIEEGLGTIDTNILPPGASMDEPASVQRARAWITFFYNAMYQNNKAQQSNAVYFSRLKSRLSSIAGKYRAYKSDPNFQVQ